MWIACIFAVRPEMQRCSIPCRFLSAIPRSAALPSRWLVTPTKSVVRSQAEQAWKPYIEKNVLPNDAKAKEIIRKGVPPGARPWVWMYTSGANKKMIQYPSPNYYKNMAAAGLNSGYRAEIDKAGGRCQHTAPAATTRLSPCKTATAVTI